ncbi:MAG: molybdopterin molybdotransferase MoeA [Pseudomonadales bacterium]
MSLMPVAQALQQLLDSARSQPAQPVDELPLEQALGHILAASVVAAHDVPPWDNSAMDGYAFNSADATKARTDGLPISQRITAGMAPEPLLAGSCARIFTGAPLPAGADCVEMQENVELTQSGFARLTQPVHAGQNVRPQGQDVRVGSQLLAAGLRLRPQDLGVIASVGLGRVAVRRPLRVAVVSTGDELVEPGDQLKSGQIFNSNRFTLIGALQRLGQQIVDGGILPDDPDHTRSRLRALADQADVIISSGGVSVGEADCLGQVLRENGEVSLWKLAIKPGKPFTLGSFANTPVLGLPGNPAATLVTFLLLVRPYLLTRLGCTTVEPTTFSLPAGFDWQRPGNRDEYLRADFVDGRILLAGNQSSGVLSSASKANGLVLIPAGSTVNQGETLSFLPFTGLFD